MVGRSVDQHRGERCVVQCIVVRLGPERHGQAAVVQYKQQTIDDNMACEKISKTKLIPVTF